MKCFDHANPNGGFGPQHNGRCARGQTDSRVHLGAAFHVRRGSACMHVCASCANELGKHAGKDTEITELKGGN